MEERYQQGEMATYYTTKSINGPGIKLVRYNNEVFFYADGVDPERTLNYVANFAFQTDDIMLCSFPKCGNHWIGHMVWKLKTSTDYKCPKFSVLELEEDSCYSDQEVPRILQTHQKPSLMPREHFKNNGKTVLMLRNPKDACVSLYHHLKNSKHTQNFQTFSEFFDSYFSGEMRSYIDYLKEWEVILNERSAGNSSMNVEVFYYEEFKIHTMENLERLNKFLGFDRDEEYLQSIVDQTSFDSVKQYAIANKDMEGKYCDTVDGSSLIYRKGKVGDWKNYFTVAQSEHVDALMKKELTKGIFSFQYDN